MSMTALTLDELAVITAIRRTPYGEVVAETKGGLIVNIRQNQTIKPPSTEIRQGVSPVS